MPKESFRAPVLGCIVSYCQRVAPAASPICLFHLKVLPSFIQQYLEQARKTPAKWDRAVEWAATYLEMEELD